MECSRLFSFYLVLCEYKFDWLLKNTKNLIKDLSYIVLKNVENLLSQFYL